MMKILKTKYARLSLRGKILLPFVSIFVVTWLGAALSLGYYINRTLERQAEREARSIASVILREFEREWQQLRLNARLLADRETIANAIQAREFATLQKILLPIRIGFNLDLIIALDRRGQLLVDLHQRGLVDTQLRDRLSPSKILNTVELSELVTAETPDRRDISVLLGTARIKSTQGIEGAILIGRVIDDLLAAEIVRGIEGEYLAIFHGDRLIATNLATARTANWQPPEAGDFSHLRIARASYLANTAAVTDFGNGKLEFVLLAPHFPLQRTQTRLWLIVGVFCGGGIAIAVMVGDRIARAIVGRLQHLVEATGQVGQGELTTRLDIAARDEVGQLSRHFNTMAAQLETRERQLQQYVDQLEQTLQELAETQSSLIIAEKMSSLGEMVAGIAHEINNPISFIYGNIPHASDYIHQLHSLFDLYHQHYPQPATAIVALQEEIDPDFLFQDLHELLASMKRGSNRIRNIVLDLRNFSRLDESEDKIANIHEGLETSLNLLHHRLKNEAQGDRICIVKDYAEVPPIHCYPRQLNQVFFSLLANAIDALELAANDPPEGDWQPTVTLKTSFVSQQKEIHIYITDNGTGIDAEIIDKIFDPFFTTKAVGQGTGLGLTVSYQIITKKHDGRLLCSSQPGRGTEFTIALPVKQSENSEL
ncbi:MAG: ATP-binding protein [Cyanobacteria bacterium P01_E01_bin.42]